MNPIWLRLLMTCSKDMKRFGLSLPFLIGAAIIGGEKVSVNTVRQLLVSMRDHTSDGSRIHLSLCDKTGHPIFSHPNNAFHSPPSYTRISDSSLYINCDVTNRTDLTIEVLAEILWNRHKEALLNGDFSYIHDKKTFCKYTDKEVDFILKVRNTPEQEEI